MAIVRESSGYTPYGASGVEGGIAINIPASTNFFICVQVDANPATGTLTLNGNSLSVRGDVAFYYGGGASRVSYIVSPPTGGSVTFLGTVSSPVAWAAYSGVNISSPFVGTDETLSQDETTPLFSDDTISSNATDMVLQLLSPVFAGGDTTVSGRNGAFVIGGMNADPYFYPSAIAELPGTGGTVTIGTLVSAGAYWSFGARTLRLAADEGGGGGSVANKTYTFSNFFDLM